MSKSAFKRATRVADQIRMEIADILMRKTKDPRFQMVTVTDVELTNDLRLAKVYVTTLREGTEETRIMSALDKATGYIRTELSRRMSLRYSPELIFKKDISGKRGDRILSLLEDVKSSSSLEDSKKEIPHIGAES